MKLHYPALLSATLALAAGVSAQTLTGYGVLKSYDVTQTGSSAPAAVAQPYSLSAYVFGTGLAGTYNFTSPGGSATSPQTLTIAGDTSSAEFSGASFATTTDLNNAYNDGIYAMALPNTNGVPQSANLPSFSGDNYPVLPTITGGTWSGGLLQIDPTVNVSIFFDPFTGFGSDDSISFRIQDTSQNSFANTSVTTFNILAGTLTPGETYTASLQFNKNSIDYGTTIGGANGNSGYSTINEFQIQAIPEPSTYAAILGALALAGVVVKRRRRERTRTSRRHSGMGSPRLMGTPSHTATSVAGS
jgi:hypothetical protein